MKNIGTDKQQTYLEFGHFLLFLGNQIYES